MTRVLVTGAAGLVGAELCAELLGRRESVVALVRGRRLPALAGLGGFTERVIDDLESLIAAPQPLSGCEVVVHLAARVHHPREHSPEAERTYGVENTQLTRRLASACVDAGVRRFVFMSSIKALAGLSPEGPLRPDAVPHPDDAYGRSKLEAERELRTLAAATGLELCIVRAPLVYGPRAGANFGQLLRWVRRGVPLPLAGVTNRRSLVSVWNLASALARCCELGRPTAGTFHVSDARAVSTPELVRLLAAGLGRRARLFAIEPGLLARALRLVGRGDLVERLLGTLELDIGESCAALGWQPPLPVEAGLERAAREYAG